MDITSPLWYFAYVTVLIGLAGYGSHRLTIIYLYLKHSRENPSHSTTSPSSPSSPSSSPSSTNSTSSIASSTPSRKSTTPATNSRSNS